MELRETSLNDQIGQGAAVFTASLLRSPLVRYILHAKVRSRHHNDVVFVGDRFIHVKEVKEQGHLEHVITKSDFDATIRAAKVFTIPTEDNGEASFIKTESDKSSFGASDLPLNCLVLTLDSNDIVFLYLVASGNGTLRWVHQTLPLPTFDRILFQPGQLLAVDPRSRAIAVAAQEKELVIYATKSAKQLQHELKTSDPNWCPVSAERPIKIEGTIQQMDFLNPSREDQDHVILLVIVVHDRKTRAICIDWYYASDIHHAHLHEGLPLDQPPNASGLLIPLRKTSFLLTNGNEIKRFDDILSGSIGCQTIDVVDDDSLNPGESSRRPMWTNWCQPERNGSVDCLYLARQDGVIIYVYEDGISDIMFSCNAGHMDCFIGPAFASVGGTDDPDILVAGGDMSSGRVMEIGPRFVPSGHPERSRSDTMEMKAVEIIPNWASATDMVVTTLPGKSQRARDGIFVTSNRQPFGCVTELRYGLDAALFLSITMDGLRSVRHVWALPLMGTGDLAVILSGPGATTLLKLTLQDEQIEAETLELSSFDSEYETRLAARIADGKLLQVTTHSICITSGADAGFEDRARIDLAPNDAILAAVCDPQKGVVVAIQRKQDASASNALASYAVLSSDDNDEGGEVPRMLSSTNLTCEALAIAFTPQSSGPMVILSDINRGIEVFSIDQLGVAKSFGKTSLPTTNGEHSMCDSLAVIRPRHQDPNAQRQLALIVCGLRDGHIVSFEATFGLDEVVFSCPETIRFSQSSVNLTQPADDGTIAYAMSGLDTCHLSWDGLSGSALRIDNIWTSDKAQPELAQGAISACTHTPSSDMLASRELADSVVFISGDDLLLARLGVKPTAVPRQIGVSGTPNRLLNLKEQRCLACASLKYGVRSFSSAPFQRRQLWPVIDFIPSKNDAPSFSYELQPGDRIYALLEWCFRGDDDRIYSFLLVGGSYVSARSQSTKGRITFLQPTNRNWEVVDVKERQQIKFDSPVYALALLAPTRFVACIGFDVTIYGYNEDDRKWKQLCRPYELHSPGTNISVGRSPDNSDEHLVFISTASDSVVVLRVQMVGNPDGEAFLRLEEHSTAPKADSSLHHLTILKDHGISDRPHNDTTLLTTKNCKLICLDSPTLIDKTISSRILFEALLPRSLTRIRQANIRPAWKPARPPGVLLDNIIGCSADGTLTGVMLIDETLWRRLSWLQRLCEWSEKLSPHSFQDPAYSVSEESFARNERGAPIGFHGGAAEGKSEVVMRTERKKSEDRHIDGDVIGRLLQHGGAVCLRELIRDAAERQDPIGQWVKAHLKEEMGAVDEMMEIVERMLESWL